MSVLSVNLIIFYVIYQFVSILFLSNLIHIFIVGNRLGQVDSCLIQAYRNPGCDVSSRESNTVLVWLYIYFFMIDFRKYQWQSSTLE